VLYLEAQTNVVYCEAQAPSEWERLLRNLGGTDPSAVWANQFPCVFVAGSHFNQSVGCFSQTWHLIIAISFRRSHKPRFTPRWIGTTVSP
jgi:hypothetical protein